MNDFSPEVRSLLNTLKKNGFNPHILNNGEKLVRDKEITADEICSVDECHLYVKDNDNKKHFIYIVLGNDPGEIAADYGDNEQLEEAIQEHYNRWCNRKQPKK